MKNTLTRRIFLLLLMILPACAPAAQPLPLTAVSADSATFTPTVTATPPATRPPYAPGELVDYLAQTGDTLPALAAHFNTSEAKIRAANPVIPQDATTMPPGFPMKIPIYYLALWGTPYQMIPDALFINGPAQSGFDLAAFINSQPGWLKNYSEGLQDGRKSAAQVIDLVAQNFSISPRLLLALLEFQAGALSAPTAPADGYFLQYRNAGYRGLYLQLVWAANTLNNGYYGWRRGALTEWKHPDGSLERPDPWQNAASVALQFYFSRQFSDVDYAGKVNADGFAKTYLTLFGDPWQTPPHISGSLNQPALMLPFEPGKSWNFTGGPHTGWGKGDPYAAIEFAPTGVSACSATGEWVVAMADGLVTRSVEDGLTVDLDGDGDERTGWVLFYLHLALDSRPKVGETVRAGQKIGHPSCEGGESTGTHVHIARKYNGEWVLADGPLGFNLAGWQVHNGARAYDGTLTRFSRTVIASTSAEGKSAIRADE